MKIVLNTYLYQCQRASPKQVVQTAKGEKYKTSQHKLAHIKSVFHLLHTLMVICTFEYLICINANMSEGIALTIQPSTSCYNNQWNAVFLGIKTQGLSIS